MTLTHNSITGRSTAQALELLARRARLVQGGARAESIAACLLDIV
jgi:hypothetical protein